MPRNTVKTSAEALYIGLATDPTYRLNYYNMYAVSRVQSASYSYSLSYTDINEFGQEARIDSLVTEAPSVPFQFSYYATDGANEKAIGFAVNTGDGSLVQNSFVSTLLNGDKGQNYFVVQSAEGSDALQSTRSTGDFVVGIGNAFVTRYSLEASVGSLAMANVSFEAFNIKTDYWANVDSSTNTGFEATAALLPSINQSNGQKASGRYFIPTYATSPQYVGGTGLMPSALRPGDILIEMTPKAGGKSMTQLGASNVASDAAHIQSFSLEVPLNRTVLGRLGNTFGYSRELNTPIEINFNMSAILADLKTSNVYDALFANEKYDLTLTIHEPSPLGDRQGSKALITKMYNFTLQNENFSSAIGNNKTVDLSFKGQVGGVNDTNGGVFMSGSYGSYTGQVVAIDVGAPNDGFAVGFYQANTVSGAPIPTLAATVAGNITLFP